MTSSITNLHILKDSPFLYLCNSSSSEEVGCQADTHLHHEWMRRRPAQRKDTGKAVRRRYKQKYGEISRLLPQRHIFTGLCNKFLSETSLGSEVHKKGDTETRRGGKEDAQRDWQETGDVEAQTNSNEVPNHSDHI